MAIAFVFPGEFDDPMDGIIYGSIVGLGMAAEESLHFLQGRSAAELFLFPQEVVRLLGHLVMGGIAGFGVGMGRMGAPGWRRALVLSFSAAVALHFSWDWVALAAADRTTMSKGLALLAAAILLAGIGIYGMLVISGSRLSRAGVRPRERAEPLGLSLQESVSVRLFVASSRVSFRSLRRFGSRFQTRTS